MRCGLSYRIAAGGALRHTVDVFGLEAEAEDGQDERQVAVRVMVKLEAFKRHLVMTGLATRQRQVAFEPVQEVIDKMRSHLNVAARLSTRAEPVRFLFLGLDVDGAAVWEGGYGDDDVDP
ncbi:hypothetical protein SARC_04688 [Sphaeroforma arctica JP610]|uniref:Uncharacterized protein n=1 Tax=Sphaeroforma arctica JP610 TaxID=667725 RepID=A0A0L0G1S1_9EUKA|nr:hypothetical protein SARC_04688 [Sphaeroforma arctica JP610]KNC83040.1 hypothetical protein SARC_04688 [Sphaeroforma arctica JP610]|eukprot:XP_014156942.1 hypothetical protein SARC_04688 [Sphaeroforma arctica JP610]